MAAGVEPHAASAARRLRSRAWLLQRSLRRPHLLPRRWRSARFARRVEDVHRQLRPITTLVALADSFGREGLVAREPAFARGWAWLAEPAPADVVALEIAYATRWLELSGGHDPAVVAVLRGERLR